MLNQFSKCSYLLAETLSKSPSLVFILSGAHQFGTNGERHKKEKKDAIL